MTMTIQRSFVVLILLALHGAALAADEREPIVGTVVPGQPIDLYYLNHLEPLPHMKVIQFQADALVAPGGPDGLLEIFFDYLDENGVEIFPVLGQTRYPIQAGAGLIPVSVGPIILPFCPTEVSIHIRALEEPGYGAPVDINGIFAHACITVPEPSTMALAALGAVGLAVAGVRRRQTRGATR